MKHRWAEEAVITELRDALTGGVAYEPRHRLEEAAS